MVLNAFSTAGCSGKPHCAPRQQLQQHNSQGINLRGHSVITICHFWGNITRSTKKMRGGESPSPLPSRPTIKGLCKPAVKKFGVKNVANPSKSNVRAFYIAMYSGVGSLAL